jgi:putative transcriptional regulator
MNAGIFLNSTSLLDDTFFENAVIFITEYNEKGAMGFVINKVFPRGLNELEEFKNGIPFPLYEGGPVDQEHLYFVHRRPDLIPGGTPVADDIFLGGDFKAAVKHINNHSLTLKDIRIFIGYCGWDYRELDEEIAEGSWQVQGSGTLFQQ